MEPKIIAEASLKIISEQARRAEAADRAAKMEQAHLQDIITAVAGAMGITDFAAWDLDPKQKAFVPKAKG